VPRDLIGDIFVNGLPEGTNVSATGGIGGGVFIGHNHTTDLVQTIVSLISSLFSNPPPSPLVLDLDGDGIELTSVDGAAAFFDVDVNGFAEATGWVAADDGLLALDVNGNGIIDDGCGLEAAVVISSSATLPVNGSGRTPAPCYAASGRRGRCRDRLRRPRCAGGDAGRPRAPSVTPSRPPRCAPAGR
jgi:hypothetical protein